MFDRGVDAIHSSQYYYATELCQSIEHLLNRLSTSNQGMFAQTDKEKSVDYFEQSYGKLTERINNELDNALASMSRTRMSYNEIRYTSLACHLLYLTKLKSINKNPANQRALDSVLARLESNKPIINCLIQSFLN